MMTLICVPGGGGGSSIDLLYGEVPPSWVFFSGILGMVQGILFLKFGLLQGNNAFWKKKVVI